MGNKGFQSIFFELFLQPDRIYRRFITESRQQRALTTAPARPQSRRLRTGTTITPSGRR